MLRSQENRPSELEISIAQEVISEPVTTDAYRTLIVLGMREDLARTLRLSDEVVEAMTLLSEEERRMLIDELRGHYEHVVAFTSFQGQGSSIVRVQLYRLLHIPLPKEVDEEASD